MHGTRLTVGLLALLLGACASSAPKSNSELDDPAGWREMREEGLAIAPVAGARVITASSDAASFFADELHTALQAALPGTPITPSGEIYGRLQDAGANAQARLRSLRRRLVRDQELDPDELSAIGDDVSQRFLLVVLMDEGAVDGLQRTTLDDYRAFSYSMGTHGYPTGELRGHAIGFLLDLGEATRVWRADIEYQSTNLASSEDPDVVIEETRADAVYRLSEALALADRGD